MKKFILLFLALFYFADIKAQLKIGENKTTINTNSMLEIESINKGVLFPRVSLTQLNNPAPMTSHVMGMVVFNKTKINDIDSGLYYNDGFKWNKISAQRQIVFVNGLDSFLTSPNNFTNGIFSPNLSANHNYIYINTKDASLWIYDSIQSKYIHLNSKSPSGTSWYLYNSTNDADSNKIASIYRVGKVGINQSNPQYSLDIKGTLRVDTTPLISTATKVLVKNPSTGQISEQILSSGNTTTTKYGKITPDSSGKTNGDVYHLTSNGTDSGIIKASYLWDASTNKWQKIGGESSNTASYYAIAIGTQKKLDSIVDKVVDGLYIVIDSTYKGDILKWSDTSGDGIGDKWESVYNPTLGNLKNNDQWTILTNITGNNAGIYTYNLSLDIWTRTSEVNPLVPAIDDPNSVGGILFQRRHLAPGSNTSGTFILYDQVAGFGKSQGHGTDGGSIVAPTYNGQDAYGTSVRKSPFTYYQEGTPYSKQISYRPFAIDFQFNGAGTISLDDKGVIHYKGTAAFVTNLTGTDAGVSTRITSAFVPDKFWANRSVKAVKFWLSYGTNNLIVLAGDGTIWTKGNNGNYGIYGDGTTTVNSLWHKVNVPQKQYKKIYITADGFACYALSSDGALYAWGYNNGNRFNSGGTGFISTPALIQTGVSDFAADANATMVIKNGVRFAIGSNINGKFGNGNTTNLTSWSSALPNGGFLIDKIYSNDATIGQANDLFYYISTDKKALHTGYNDESRASSASAGNVTAIAQMGNGEYQGTVMDIRCYSGVTLIHTTQGTIWTAVNGNGANYSSGWGINVPATNGVGLNVFKQVPIPSLAISVQSSSNDAGSDGFGSAQFTVLTDEGRVYNWGGWTMGMDETSVKHAPQEIPTQMYRQGTPKNNNQVDLMGLTASISTLGVGTASDLIDGVSGQTITFSVPYTGSIGVLNTSSWSLTLANGTAASITNPIYVLTTSGTITFTATVNATDIASLTPPNSQTQSYNLNIGTTSTTINGTRATDSKAGSLTTSLAAYNAAPANSWIWITATEYNALITSLGTSTTGVNEATMATSPTNYSGFTNSSTGMVNVATNGTGANNIAANNYLTMFSTWMQSGTSVAARIGTISPVGAVAATFTQVGSALPIITLSSTQRVYALFKGNGQIAASSHVALMWPEGIVERTPWVAGGLGGSTSLYQSDYGNPTGHNATGTGTLISHPYIHFVNGQYTPTLKW